MTTSRRLAADAKIVLENFYRVQCRPTYININDSLGHLISTLWITSGTVDNAEVERLLKAAQK